MKDYYKAVVKREYPDKPFMKHRYPKKWWYHLTTNAKSFVNKLMFEIKEIFPKKITEEYYLYIKTYVYTSRDIETNNYPIAMAFHRNKYVNILQGGRLQFNGIIIKEIPEQVDEYVEVYFKPVRKDKED